MTRPLNIISAAIVVAAGFSAPAVAGPTDGGSSQASSAGQVVENSSFQTSAMPADLKPSDLLSWHLQRGLTDELRRNSIARTSFDSAVPLYEDESGSTDELLSPGWLATESTVNPLSQPVIDDVSTLLFVTDPPIPSPEVASMSVPEVPLPLNVIPAFAGIVTVLVIHHRSLRSSKIRK